MRARGRLVAFAGDKAASPLAPICFKSKRDEGKRLIITTPWIDIRVRLYIVTELDLMAPLFVVKHNLAMTGRENVPAPPFVAVANHLSKEDPPLLVVALRRPVAFIAKQELYTVPILRSLILFYGAISIDRDKPEVSTFKAVKEVCRHG